MDDRVDMSTAVGAVRRRPQLALAVFLAVFGLGLLVTALMPRVYASTSTVLVGDTTDTFNVAREDILASRDLAATYTDLARRQPILDGVVAELGLDVSWLELRERVQVNLAPGNSQLIVIEALAGSEREANQIARTVTDLLIAQAPSRDAEPTTSFVTTQLERLQSELDTKQLELAAVVARQGGAVSPQEAASLQSRADVLIRQISDLRGSYTDLRTLVPRGSGPNSLQVLEPATPALDPVRPNLAANLVASALVGLLLAVAVTHHVERRPGPPAHLETSEGKRRPGPDPEPRAPEQVLAADTGTTPARAPRARSPEGDRRLALAARAAHVVAGGAPARSGGPRDRDRPIDREN